MASTYTTLTHQFMLTGASTAGSWVLVTLTQGSTSLVLAETGYTGACDGCLSVLDRDGTTTIGEFTLTQSQTALFVAGSSITVRASAVGGTTLTSNTKPITLGNQLLIGVR